MRDMAKKREAQKRYALSEKGKETQRRADAKRAQLRIARHAERITAAKASGCTNCGATEKLHFHHVDPATKRYTVAVMTNASDATFAAELAKCVILCSACHIRRHQEMRAADGEATNSRRHSRHAG